MVGWELLSEEFMGLFAAILHLTDQISAGAGEVGVHELDDLSVNQAEQHA